MKTLLGLGAALSIATATLAAGDGEASLKAADAQRNGRHYHEAVELIRRAAHEGASESAVVKALIDVAETATNASHDGKASLEAARTAVELAPRNAAAHTELGRSLREDEQAIAEYRRAIALDPAAREPRELLVGSLRKLGRWEERIHALEELAQVTGKKDESFYAATAECLCRLRRYSEGLDAYEKALAARTSHGPAYYERDRQRCSDESRKR